MPLSLFQPSFNASLFNDAYHFTTVPSTYPRPISPDDYTCDSFYAEPVKPQLADCQIASDLLPSGNAGQPFSYHFNDDDPNRLPITVSHGTCEIVFATSGGGAAERDPIIIIPTDIRNMAGWIIDQCVRGENLGGAIQKGFKNAADWILDPTTNFPNAAMPASTTYLSLWLWNWKEPQDDWNAGNNDPELAYVNVDYFTKTVNRMPESLNKEKLDQRIDLLYSYRRHMSFEYQQDWWSAH